MNIITDSRIINLNSKHAVLNNGDKLSDVYFKFKNILRDEDDILYCSLGILNAQIPVSFYNVNINNQTLYYTVNATPYTLIIPESNYTYTSFASVFTAQFALGAHGKTLTLSQNRTSGKITITVSGYTLVISASPLNKVLGLNVANSYTITGAYTCVYPCNFLGVKKIKFYSSALSCYSYDSFNLGHSTVIHTISVNAPAFGLLDFSAQMDSFSRLKQTRINEIDIQLRDEDDALIDFNGTDWCFTLQLNILRQLRMNVVSFDLYNSKQLNIIGKTPLGISKTPPPTPDLENYPDEEEEYNPDLEELNLLTS